VAAFAFVAAFTMSILIHELAHALVAMRFGIPVSEINLGFFAAAGVVWILVALVVTTRDPRLDPGAGYVGALLIGLIQAFNEGLSWFAPGSDWTRSLVFAILIAILVFRPEGLLGERTPEGA